MYFIGDIHGDFKAYEDILIDIGQSPSMQVGDMGIGWPGQPIFPKNSYPDIHRFIRGNHDNPYACAELKECIFKFEYSNGTLYISGGESRDKKTRTVDFDYWESEELTYRELTAIVDLAIQLGSERIVSHEAPISLVNILWPGLQSASKSRTAQALDIIWKKAPPMEWIFGHYHMSRRARIGPTRVYALGIKETIWLD